MDIHMLGSDPLVIPGLMFLSSKSTSLNAVQGMPSLNSVDEEDIFLYGESNEVSEEKLSIKEKNLIDHKTIRHENEWSDEDDPYGNFWTFQKLNLRDKKDLSEYDSQHEETFLTPQKSVKFPDVKKEENLQTSTSSKKMSAQIYASSKLQYDDSFLLSGIEKNNFKENNSISVRTKSECHAATEILKKRTEHFDNEAYITREAQKEEENRDHDFSIEQHSRREFFSPSKYNSVFTSQPNHNFSYPSSEMDYIRSSSYLKSKSPNFETKKHCHSKAAKHHAQYSPKRWVYSIDTGHHRRSSEKSKDFSKYKTSRSRRSRSRSPRYYSSRNKRRWNQSSKKNDYYLKEKEIYNSADSFCSLSLGSSSPGKSDEISDDNSSNRRSRSFGYSHHRRYQKSSYYSRYKHLSPRSRISKSRSPVSSRNKVCDKKKGKKSPKKYDYYFKKEEICNSADSFCSLSLGSSSSPGRSDESADEKISYYFRNKDESRRSQTSRSRSPGYYWSHMRRSSSPDNKHCGRSREKNRDYSSYKERFSRPQRFKLRMRMPPSASRRPYD